MFLSRTRRARYRKYRQRRTNIILVICGVVIFSLLAASFGGLITAAAIISSLPKLKNQGEKQNWQTTKIYAADGTLLTDLYFEQDRIVVKLSDISPYMQHAVIAIEDERFYKHKGYDPEAIARAFLTDIQTGHIVEGASTITQQYIKNMENSREKTFERKLKEAALAYQLEKVKTKDQILEMYLNTIYFGHSWYGVETASQNFFGKRAKDLTLPEAALLAGIIKSPNNFSPYEHPNEAKQRRDLVIAQMRRLNFISAQEAAQAIASPVAVRPLSKPVTIAPYFVDYVKQQLIDKYGENVVFKGGLRVYTTIDLKMQQYAESAAWSTLNLPNDPSAALVAIEPSTGYIKAMVGGRNFEESEYNLATSHNRQPGSSFKTFVFAAAIENGISPYHNIDSSPGSIPIPGSKKPWRVNNYVEGSGYGPMSIREALVKSVNTVYARLIMEVGLDKVVDLAKRVGINIKHPVPAIALGGFSNGPSVLEMASAYSTLANNGKRLEPTAITKITDSAGKVLYEYRPEPKQVMSEITAYIVTDVLQDVIRYGTGTRARLNRPCAGKTGTATEYRDAWFCGFTPDLSAAVWVGYPKDQKTSMYRVHGIRVAGGTFPAEIWNKFMTAALQDVPHHDFIKPAAGVISVLVCADSGQLANKYCVNTEYRTFADNEIPKQRCPLHAKPSIVEIPNVVGSTEQEAVNTLEKLHFGHSVTYKADSKTPRGTVLAQTPSAGEKARQDTVVQMVVSAGPNGASANQTIRMPKVIGLDGNSARLLLESLGVQVVDITATPYLPGKSKQNKVIYQNPDEKTELQPGQVVTIYVNRK
ncbi:MAG: PBP1A family penicillin-binding protein [Firmicutes bacterium]|nr:PBP1A family penicillin-binding protein [Bacillota bacterium]